MSIKYVEYLETDGSSYILIPKGTITYNNNIGIEVKYQYEDAENYTDVYVCGTSGNGLSNVIGVKQGMWSLNAYMYGQNFYHYIGNIDNAFVNYTSCPHTITMNKNNRLLDGNAFIYTEGVGATTYTNVDQSVFDALADSYFGVFCIGYGSDIPYYKALEKTRVYYVKIFNGDELQLYLKPCLDDSNIPCMYDEVSQTYYYNSGTGIFSYGDEVNNNLYLFANNNEGTAENLGSYRLYNMKIEGDSEGVESGINYVDYLIGDGASYIDTGITPTLDMIFYGDYTLSGANHVAFGCMEFIRSFGIYQGAPRVYYGGLTSVASYYTLKEYNHRYQVTLSPDGYIVKDITSNINIEQPYLHTPNGSSNKTVKVFAEHTNAGVVNHTRGKIYEFKIWDTEGALIQHLRPCLDEEGIPCMYDEVTKQYFYNKGTGTFGYKKKLRDFQPVLDSNGVPCLMDKINKKYYYDKNGNVFGCDGYSGVSYLKGDGASWIDTGLGKSIGYTPIKYIETNGTQYIDTGVVVNDNTYMDIDYRAVDKLHYIEDGLILRLDAIDNTRDGHNASSTVWEDLSGNGLDFDLTDVTVNDTTMTFNGTSSVGTLQDIELWRNIVNNTEQYTVEVCFKFKASSGSYQSIISTNLGNVNVAKFVNSIQVGQQSIGTKIEEVENNAFLQRQLSTISCDANDITYHVNTKLRETLDNGDYIYPPTTDVFWIGARLTGAYYRFDGEICSIRIYNKKLTDEERLYNHSSDVARYGVPTDVSVIDTNRNYLMNDFYTDTTYKYKEIDTTVEPNLTASDGATLTLGSTYMAYLTESEIEQATKNGWIVE